MRYLDIYKSIKKDRNWKSKYKPLVFVTNFSLDKLEKYNFIIENYFEKGEFIIHDEARDIYGRLIENFKSLWHIKDVDCKKFYDIRENIKDIKLEIFLNKDEMSIE